MNLKPFQDPNPGVQGDEIRSPRRAQVAKVLMCQVILQPRFRILFWREMIFKVFASNLSLFLAHILWEYFLGKHTTVLLACKSYLPGPTFFWGRFQKSSLPTPVYGPRAETVEGKCRYTGRGNLCFPTPASRRQGPWRRKRTHNLKYFRYKKTLTSQQVTRRYQVYKQSSLIAVLYPL